MAAEKAAQILRVRSDFSEEEISAMSDSQAWNWIYLQDQQRKDQRGELLPEICFTGFFLAERSALETKAAGSNLTVKPSVTKTLRYLCTGSDAGPAKIVKARGQGVTILSATDFHKLCSKLDPAVHRNSGFYAMQISPKHCLTSRSTGDKVNALSVMRELRMRFLAKRQ